MTQAGFHIFDDTFRKSILLLQDIEKELGWPEERRIHSYSALRAVLLTLRDGLTAAQAVKLGEQLPSLIRDMYFEGWLPEKVPRKMDKVEFVNEIRREFGYSVDTSIEDVIRTVIGVLAKRVSRGAIEDMRNELPADFRTFFEEPSTGFRKTA